MERHSLETSNHINKQEGVSLEETNKMQILLMQSSGMDAPGWIKLYGDTFRLLIESDENEALISLFHTDPDNFTKTVSKELQKQVLH